MGVSLPSPSPSPPPPPGNPGGSRSHRLQESQALADSPETQFQPVTDPSVPAVMEMVDLALRSYFLTPASDSKLANPDEVHEAIRDIKVSKAPGPNGIPNRALKRLPQRAVSLLAQIFPSRKPTLLVIYLESYLNDLQRWLSEWRIAINVSKSTAIIFARADWRFIQPRTVTLFGEPIQ